MDYLLQVPARAKSKSRHAKDTKRQSPSSKKSPVISIADIFDNAGDLARDVSVDNNDVIVNDVIEEDYELDDEDYAHDYASLYERSNIRCQKSSWSSANGGLNAPKIIQHRQQLLSPHKWKHSVKKQKAIAANRSAAKQNIEKHLERKGLYRQGPAVFERAWCDKMETQTCSKHKSKSRREPANNGDSAVVLQHALKKSDVKKSNATSHLLKIVDIQHRDITPEDYELLLQLDNDVAPQTVSQETLKNLETASPSEFGLAGELCSICMELFKTEDVLKKLLCGHCFHSPCIDQWLTYSSCACPLDGLPVVQ